MFARDEPVFVQDVPKTPVEMVAQADAVALLLHPLPDVEGELAKLRDHNRVMYALVRRRLYEIRRAAEEGRPYGEGPLPSEPP